MGCPGPGAARGWGGSVRRGQVPEGSASPTAAEPLRGAAGRGGRAPPGAGRSRGAGREGGKLKWGKGASSVRPCHFRYRQESCDRRMTRTSVSILFESTPFQRRTAYAISSLHFQIHFWTLNGAHRNCWGWNFAFWNRGLFLRGEKSSLWNHTYIGDLKPLRTTSFLNKWSQPLTI